MVMIRFLKDFDAKTYTEVVLDQTLQGKIGEEADIIEGSTKEQLLAQYEAGIEAFVQNNIVNDAPMSEEMQAQYVALMKQAFAAMKYKVGEAEKVDKQTFRVPVTYQPTDLFAKFAAAVSEETKALEKKTFAGEYKGTQEEIHAQMQDEFLNNCYAHMEQLVTEITYGEQQTMVLTVQAGETGQFSIPAEELTQFIEKILGLDAIQD